MLFFCMENAALVLFHQSAARNSPNFLEIPCCWGVGYSAASQGLEGSHGGQAEPTRLQGMARGTPDLFLSVLLLRVAPCQGRARPVGRSGVLGATGLGWQRGWHGAASPRSSHHLSLQLDPQAVQTKNWHMDVIEMNGVSGDPQPLPRLQPLPRG